MKTRTLQVLELVPFLTKGDIFFVRKFVTYLQLQLYNFTFHFEAACKQLFEYTELKKRISHENTLPAQMTFNLFWISVHLLFGIVSG